MTTYFSTPVAIVLTLFAAAMWGSWMQVVKLKKDYPITGIAFMMYMFSFVLVWGVSLILSPVLLEDNIFAEIAKHTDVMGEIMLGGAMMSVGLVLSLTVMSEIGLMLATTLSGAITSIMGIVTSISKEGLPENPLALPLIIITAVVFILAGVICSHASSLCAKDRAEASGAVVKEKPKTKVTAKVLMLILLNSFFTNGWASGTATGTAAGLEPILTCAYMVTGSALSMLVVGAVLFTWKKQWKTVLCIGDRKMPLLLSAISACCHYGGNMLSIYAMPVLSATMSFLFGKTSSVWTYFWGFYYKEFQGAKKKTLLLLLFGIGLYFGAIGLLFWYNYG